MNERPEMQTANQQSDLWHVQVGPGDVRTMSLDDLDAAFTAGHIAATTNVWQDGMTEWLTLGELAGLDGDNAEAETPAPAPVAIAAAPVQQIHPGSVHPSVNAYATQASQFPPRVAQPRAIPSAWPPVAAAPAMNQASMPGLRSAPTPSGMGVDAPMSMAPLAFDLADLDMQPKPRRKVGFVIMGVVAAAGIGLFAYNASFALNRPKVNFSAEAPAAAAAPARATELPSRSSSSTTTEAKKTNENLTASLTSSVAKSTSARRSSSRPHAARARPSAKKSGGGGKKMSEFDPMNDQL